MKLHKLQERNFKNVFIAWDSNNDGVLAKEDYEAIIQRFAEYLNIELTSDSYKLIQSFFMEDWEAMKENADVNKDGVISLEEWLDATGKALDTDEGYQAIVLNYPSLMGTLMDHDNDGKVTLEEYGQFLYCFALVNEEDAKICFEKCDLDGDGFLTVDEIIELGREFAVSSDPDAPGHWLFGPPW